MSQSVKRGLALVGVIALSATNAMAEVDTTDVVFDTASANTVGALVLAAVAVIWGVRKAISMANRG